MGSKLRVSSRGGSRWESVEVIGSHWESLGAVGVRFPTNHLGRHQQLVAMEYTSAHTKTSVVVASACSACSAFDAALVAFVLASTAADSVAATAVSHSPTSTSTSTSVYLVRRRRVDRARVRARELTHHTAAAVQATWTLLSVGSVPWTRLGGAAGCGHVCPGAPKSPHGLSAVASLLQRTRTRNSYFVRVLSPVASQAV